MTDAEFDVVRLDGLTALRAHDDPWNDLWSRSSTANPLGRAEPTMLWIEAFAPNAPVRTIAVVDRASGRWLAALCLVRIKRCRILKVGHPPRLAGGPVLLIEPGDQASAVMDELVRQLCRERDWHWIWPEEIRLDSFEWSLFQETLRRCKIPFQCIMTHQTAVLPLEGTFEELVGRWSKSKVKDMKKRLRRLSGIGTVELAVMETPEEIRTFLPVCYEIEDRSWKGTEQGGLSILQQGWSDYYTRSALSLAERHQMFLFGLTVDGTWIAFFYAFAAKDRLFSNKIGFLPEFKEFSPGIVLRMLICRYLRERHAELRRFDCVGEYRDHQQYWNPILEPVGQIVFPTAGFVSRSAFFLYDKIMPVYRRMRNR